MTLKAVLLDRDGVINEHGETYIGRPEDWHPIPGSLEAIRRFNELGLFVAIITNQSGIARGVFSRTDLMAVHSRMHQLLAEQGAWVDAVYFCPHHPDDRCHCRKPEPQLIEQFFADTGFSPDQVAMVGDRCKDLQAAHCVGVSHLYLVQTGLGKQEEEQVKAQFGNSQCVVCNSLIDVVDFLTKTD